MGRRRKTFGQAVGASRRDRRETPVRATSLAHHVIEKFIEESDLDDIFDKLKKKLDHDFARHVASEETVPLASEGELIYYTRVFLDGSVKITEHRIRDAIGQDTIVMSFSEVL